MLNLKLPSKTDGRTLDFLNQNPSISQSLLAEAGHDMGRVSTIIRPVLEAPQRCEISSYYIQAVTTGRTAFLTTNLPSLRTAHVTEAASGWLIGRSPNCAIAVEDPSISRCHAVVGHRPHQGFYIIDVGSSNGTFVNGSRLVAMEQRILKDGDLIELSHTCVEFFVSGWRHPVEGFEDTAV
jgi:pSer/pThr/pTyr-binding forkhead associated (FHA) protein